MLGGLKGSWNGSFKADNHNLRQVGSMEKELEDGKTRWDRIVRLERATSGLCFYSGTLFPQWNFVWEVIRPDGTGVSKLTTGI